jgi:hypothetical protein
VQGLGLVAARPVRVVLHAGVTSQTQSAKATRSEHKKIIPNLLAYIINFDLSDRHVQSRHADFRAIYTNRGQQDAMPTPITCFGPPASVLFVLATDCSLYCQLILRWFGDVGMMNLG